MQSWWTWGRGRECYFRQDGQDGLLDEGHLSRILHEMREGHSSTVGKKVAFQAEGIVDTDAWNQDQAWCVKGLETIKYRIQGQKKEKCFLPI